MKQIAKITLFMSVVLTLALLLAGCGGTDDTTTSGTAPSVPESQSAPSEPAFSEAPASGSDSAAPDEEEEALNTDDLVPIYGNQIANGSYAIEVLSSSSMFRVVDCQLTVAAGEMTAVLTLSGTGYEKLYMGTGEEAEAASDDQYAYFVEDAEGAYTYEVPVEALDMGIDCAAFSIRKQTWYDRVLVFQADLISADAITQ